jgi:hypothetical protein
VIGDYAFARRRIRRLEIPASVEIIGPMAFSSCLELQRVIFCEPSLLIRIDQSGFISSGITEISFPSSLKSIGPSAFAYTFSLERVEFPEFVSLEAIGSRAFASSRFQQLSVGKMEIADALCIPESLRKIESDAFFECSQIHTVVFRTEPRIMKIGGMASTCIETINIPDSVVEIGEKAFFLCGKLKIVEIGVNSELQKIEDRAFAFSGLRSFRAPSPLKHVAHSAFSAIPLLSEISFCQVIETCLFDFAAFNGDSQIDRVFIEFSENALKDQRRQWHRRARLIPNKAN